MSLIATKNQPIRSLSSSLLLSSSSPSHHNHHRHHHHYYRKSSVSYSKTTLMFQLLILFVLFLSSQGFSSIITSKSILSSPVHSISDKSTEYLKKKKTNNNNDDDYHFNHRNGASSRLFHRKSLQMLQSGSNERLPSLSDSSMSSLITQATTIPQQGVDSITAKEYRNEYDLSPQQFIYVILTSIFITCLIIADVIGVKLFEIPLPFEIFGHKTVEHTCGMLTFPITFILGDIINEYYGPKAAKNTVYLGLAMSILVFTVMNIAQFMPYLDKPFNVSKDSFDAIFGSAKLMYVASICAYLIGSLSDIWIFGIIKKVTKGKLLWLRATGSTVISQIIDSFVVSYIAFSLGKTLNGLPAASMTEVLNIAATGYGLKFFLAASLTPLLYVLKSLLTEKYGLKPIPFNANEDDAVMEDFEKLKKY